MTHPFWDFSLAVYAAPGVQAECLDLQERFGVDVNLLLFSAYMGAKGMALAEADIAEIVRLVDEWHKAVVMPLRAVRRSLKSTKLAAPLSAKAQEMRSTIKALELESEYIEQSLLTNWGETHLPNVQYADASPDPVEQNVRLLLRHYVKSWQEQLLPSALLAAVCLQRPSQEKPA